MGFLHTGSGTGKILKPALAWLEGRHNTQEVPSKARQDVPPRCHQPSALPLLAPAGFICHLVMSCSAGQWTVSEVRVL